VDGRLSSAAMSLEGAPGLWVKTMRRAAAHPVVHLELHTDDLPGARAFYAELFGWRPEQIHAREGIYNALEMGGGVGGGIVECTTERALWLPYVEVDRTDEATERARRLGGSVLMGPREGPAGWRSVVASPAGGEIAFWQQKR
jgi:predicted enzyme related to lactoylglutathione lyase